MTTHQPNPSATDTMVAIEVAEAVKVERERIQNRLENHRQVFQSIIDHHQSCGQSSPRRLPVNLVDMCRQQIELIRIWQEKGTAP